MYANGFGVLYPTDDPFIQLNTCVRNKKIQLTRIEMLSEVANTERSQQTTGQSMAKVQRTAQRKPQGQRKDLEQPPETQKRRKITNHYDSDTVLKLFDLS